MPQIDPKYIFWLSIVIAVCGVGSNVTVWTGAIPAVVVPIVAKWSSIFDSFGQVLMPLLLGQGMTVQGRIAAAVAIPEVKSVVAESAVAAAAPSDKVVNG